MKSPVQPILTVADLDAMPDDGNRYELIDGELLVSRAPSFAHQLISQNFQMTIGLYLADNPIGKVVSGVGVIFDEYRSAIPDVLFVKQDRVNEVVSGGRLIGAPDLIIEILSPGAENERRDRIIKRRLYGEQGVKEYWIADPANRTIEIYELKDKGLQLTAMLGENDEITSSVLPGFRYEVARIFDI
ncbi:MAG: Uma2 family endonuclease [Blastocatellia bacterium]|nr:Uma2 family endonuclease [Blastocatellia bacterium]